MTDEDILKELIESVPAQLEAKFRAGMAKYKEPLIEKDCLAEAVPEALDLIVYLTAAEIQKRQAHYLVKRIQGRSMQDDRLLRELETLLEPKPLATKKPTVSGELLYKFMEKASEPATRPPKEGDVKYVSCCEHGFMFSAGAWRIYDP